MTNIKHGTDYRDPGTYKEEKQNEKVFGYECITHSDCSNDLRMQQSKQ